MLEKLFKLKQNNTNVRTELIAGLTTFMTMAYILAVNPSILADAGMDPTAVLLATCLASFIGTACMALMANLPFALSAGMGLNAFLAYTVVITMGYSWQVALLAVFIEGKTMREVAFFVAEKLATIEDVTSTATHFVLRKYKDKGIVFGAVPTDDRGNFL